jgi:hypothetical protein
MLIPPDSQLTDAGGGAATANGDISDIAHMLNVASAGRGCIEAVHRAVALLRANELGGAYESAWDGWTNSAALTTFP